MLDQAIRFGAILSQPEFADSGPILEVGSGALGIRAFIHDLVIGIDVHFPQPPVVGLAAIKASVCLLPLRDAACDRVVCSDMLEHLASEERAAAIIELLRVTGRHLFLACPCDEGARRADDRLNRLYEFLKVPTPIWLTEHVQRRIPDAAQVRSVLQRTDFTWREMNGESIASHWLTCILIASRLLNRFWASLFRQRPERAKAVSRWPIWRGKRHYRKLWVIRKPENMRAL